MTYVEKLLVAQSKLVEMGNTDEEASVLLGHLMHDATMDIPDRVYYSKEFVLEKRQEKLTARQNLLKLPYGMDIIKQEEKLLRN